MDTILHSDNLHSGKLHSDKLHSEKRTVTSRATRREPGLDLLRAMATIRVVLWHATGIAALTWIGALPAMFFLSGRFLGTGSTNRPVRVLLFDRFRRLLLPYWAFGAAMAVIMVVVSARTGAVYTPSPTELFSWILPVRQPTGAIWQEGWITQPLWYLRCYLWLLMATPILLVCLRRGPRRTVAVLVLATAVGELVLAHRAWAVQDFWTYGAFFATGLATGAGLLRIEPRTARRAAPAFAAGAALLGMWRSPLDGVVNNSHLLHLVVGAAWLAAALGWVHRLDAACTHPVVRRSVAVFTRRSLTIYLWHAPILGLTWLAAHRMGLGRSSLVTAVVILTGTAVLALWLPFLGRVEDRAARRSTGDAPKNASRDGAVRMGTRTLAAAPLRLAVVLTAVLAVSAVRGDTKPGGSLPPTPSKAPTMQDLPVSEELLTQLAGGLEPLATADVAADAVQAQPTKSTLPVTGDLAGGSNDAPKTNTAPKKPTKNTAPKKQLVVQPPPQLSRVAPFEDLAPAASETLTAEAVAAVARWAAANNKANLEFALLVPGRLRMAAVVNSDGTVAAPSASLPLASVTKSYTAALLLRAIDEGRITINTKVGILDKAPFFTLAKNVTVGQLLSHRSGLVAYNATADWSADWTAIDGWEPALRGVQAYGPLFAPGAQQGYSSTNYIVAGLLAEQLYHTPIETLITEKLLGPLGLEETTVGAPAPGAPGTGTGNMRASITDTVRWAMARWRDDAVLGPKGRKLGAYIDPAANLGYGSFGYCPCTKIRGSKPAATRPAGIGHNGAEHTLRWYRGVDTIVSIHVPGGVPEALETLVAELVAIAAR